MGFFSLYHFFLLFFGSLKYFVPLLLILRTSPTLFLSPSPAFSFLFNRLFSLPLDRFVARCLYIPISLRYLGPLGRRGLGARHESVVPLKIIYHSPHIAPPCFSRSLSLTLPGRWSRCINSEDPMYLGVLHDHYIPRSSPLKLIRIPKSGKCYARCQKNK